MADCCAMAEEILFILGSVILVSLVSFVGALTLSLNRQALSKILLVLVAFGAGSLIGGALFDLIPKAIELGEGLALQAIAGGIVLFFVIERLIHLHHHHHYIEHHHQGQEFHPQKIKPFAYLNLAGEGIHNFLDGTIIAASYLISFELGLVSTIAILLHEIPQELGDFGILIQGGLPVRKALFYNFLVALTAVLGAVATFLAAGLVQNLTLILLSLGAGGFLYISLSNLIPELHHETNPGKQVLQLVFLVLGIALLYFLGVFLPG